jgi:hypothetical protein
MVLYRLRGEIMAPAKLTAIRIPEKLLERIERYGKVNHPKGSQDWEITATLLDLLARGLEGTPTLPRENRITLTVEDVREIVREELGKVSPLPPSA